MGKFDSPQVVITGMLISLVNETVQINLNCMLREVVCVCVVEITAEKHWKHLQQITDTCCNTTVNMPNLYPAMVSLLESSVKLMFYFRAQ